MSSQRSNISNQKLNTSECPAEATINLLSGRWKLLIFQELSETVKRFNQLERSISGITRKMLTQQLREMEAYGIIHREVYPEVPPRVEYSLTELGKSLTAVVETMHDWSQNNLHSRP
ncbi:MAG: winged helix-turn-helix transcriptional regulator [Microcoleaceae cyanobacterium]